VCRQGNRFALWPALLVLLASGGCGETRSTAPGPAAVEGSTGSPPQTANLVVLQDVPTFVDGSPAYVAGMRGTPIDTSTSPCHFFAAKRCVVTFQIRNTGPGCAGNIRGIMTQYRDTASLPLRVAASAHFTVPQTILEPGVMVVNARFSTFSFDTLGSGEYCPFVFVVLSWDSVGCPSPSRSATDRQAVSAFSAG
jgi:hypothetical protein